MNSSTFWEGRLYAFLAVNKMRRLQHIPIRGTTRCVEKQLLTSPFHVKQRPQVAVVVITALQEEVKKIGKMARKRKAGG